MKLGRWISRDPIGERGGINLYGFVRNRVASGKDVLGLEHSVYAPNATTSDNNLGFSFEIYHYIKSDAIQVTSQVVYAKYCNNEEETYFRFTVDFWILDRLPHVPSDKEGFTVVVDGWSSFHPTDPVLESKLCILNLDAEAEVHETNVGQAQNVIRPYYNPNDLGWDWQDDVVYIPGNQRGQIAYDMLRDHLAGHDPNVSYKVKYRFRRNCTTGQKQETLEVTGDVDHAPRKNKKE